MSLDLLPIREARVFDDDLPPLGDLSALELVDSGLPVVLGGTVTFGNSAARTLTIPSYAAVGHVGVIFWAASTSGFTNPDGWTQYDDGTAGSLGYRVLWRAIQSGDAGTAVTLTAGSTTRQAGMMLLLSGVDVAAPFVEVPAEAVDSTTSATRTNPTATPSGT